MTTKKTSDKEKEEEVAAKPAATNALREKIAKYALEKGEFYTQNSEIPKDKYPELVKEVQAMIESGLLQNSKPGSGYNFKLTTKGEVYAKTLK